MIAIVITLQAFSLYYIYNKAKKVTEEIEERVAQVNKAEDLIKESRYGRTVYQKR